VDDARDDGEVDSPSPGEPPLLLRRRRDGGTYVVEDDAGRVRATCRYRLGLLRRIDADGVAHQVKWRWWRSATLDVIDSATGRRVLTLRQLTITIDGGAQLRCATRSKDGGPRTHRADEARMTVTDSHDRIVMSLTWDGARASFGTSTKTFERGTAEIDAAAVGSNVGVLTAVAFHAFSTGRGGAG
jgi:hypothetical protein